MDPSPIARSKVICIEVAVVGTGFAAERFAVYRVFVILAVGLYVFVGCTRLFDKPQWNEERAKAEVANYLYGDATEKWEKQVAAASSGYSVSILLRNPPKKMSTVEWTASYGGKGVWQVSGPEVGVWAAFEDGTEPVPKELPKPTPTVTPKPTATPLPCTVSGSKGLTERREGFSNDYYVVTGELSSSCDQSVEVRYEAVVYLGSKVVASTKECGVYSYCYEILGPHETRLMTVSVTTVSNPALRDTSYFGSEIRVTEVTAR